MNELTFLKNIGVPEKAGKVYISLLDLAEASVTDIALHSKLHRAEIYKALPLLKEYRLVSAVAKGKRTLYRSSSPEVLDSLYQEFLQRGNEAIQSLQNRHNSNGLRARLEHREGVPAIAEIYTDALRLTPSGESYLRYSSGRDLYDKSMYSSKEYERLKKTKNVGRLVISNSLFKYRKNTDPNREVVAIPKNFDLFEDNISKLIYGDRVAIIDHDSKEAFVIESPRFAEYERKLFRLLFRYLRKEEMNTIDI